MKIEIAVLNYNGAYLMGQCLPSVLDAARRSRHNCKLVVVDNASTDNSREVIKEQFPQFEFFPVEENKVLCSLNKVAAVSEAEIMIFLNNDLKVDVNFIDPLIEIFLTRKNVFLAAARVYNFEGDDLEEGRTKLVFSGGVFKAISKYKGYEKELNDVAYTFQAGFGAFSRKIYLQLGGYDSLYLPGILEDTDICFRAWRRGYVAYYQPASHIFHMGKESFKKRYGNRKLLAISHRNSYIFIWKNILDRKIVYMSIILLLPRMAYALATFKWEIIWGFCMFLPRFPEVIRKRRSEFKKNTAPLITDRQILGLFG
jgi:GT2 family glycosyltransferase